MGGGRHRPIEQELPPVHVSTGYPTVKHGDPCNQADSRPRCEKTGCHKQWVDDRLIPRFPRNGPKGRDLSPNSQVEQGRKGSP